MTLTAESIVDPAAPAAPVEVSRPPRVSRSGWITGAAPTLRPTAPAFGPVAARVTTGVVKTVTGGSLTVATADGSPVTVNASVSTVVTVVTPGTLAALRVGDQIQVTGTTGSDGAIAAASIRAGALGPSAPVAN